MFYAEGADALLFTENETNRQRLWGEPNASPYVKDAFHRWLIDGDAAAVNPAATGTKAAAVWALDVPAGGSAGVSVKASCASAFTDGHSRNGATAGVG